MKLKNTVEIIDITHEDLVILFSTALYGSSYLSAEYDKIFTTPFQRIRKKVNAMRIILQTYFLTVVRFISMMPTRKVRCITRTVKL